MPRKPQLPKVLVIQTLSNGQIAHARVLDDFTGEAIPLKIPALPVRELEGAEVIRDRQHRAKAKAQRELLERVMPERMGRVKPRVKMVAPHVPGKRVIGRLGDKAIYVTLPPWRRS